MPTKEELDAMANLIGYNRGFDAITAGIEVRAKIAELTIAAKQAKALADIAYLYGFSNQRL